MSKVKVGLLALIPTALIAALAIAGITTRNNQKFVSPLGTSFSLYAFENKKESAYMVYGFLPYWSLPDIEYLQPDKLTDIAYFGLYINRNGTFQTDEPGYTNWRNSSALTDLFRKVQNSRVRISLTVLSHDELTSEQFLNCEKCWATFMTSLKEELDYRHIVNVNLNFESSGEVSEAVADKYTKFVSFVNRNLKRIYGHNAKLVVSVFADAFVKPRITKAKDLAEISDQLFIMAYDFSRPDSDYAGAVAPITGSNYNITTMLQDYLANIPANKLLLGVPYYGYNWVVQTAKPNAQRIPGTDYIGYSQSQIYSYILDTLLDLRIKTQWDDLAKSPFFTYVSPASGSTRQVYFENVQSLREKYKLVKQHELAGIGIWALGYDGGYVDLWELLKEQFFSPLL